MFTPILSDIISDILVGELAVIPAGAYARIGAPQYGQYLSSNFRANPQ